MRFGQVGQAHAWGFLAPPWQKSKLQPSFILCTTLASQSLGRRTAILALLGQGLPLREGRLWRKPQRLYVTPRRSSAPRE